MVMVGCAKHCGGAGHAGGRHRGRPRVDRMLDTRLLHIVPFEGLRGEETSKIKTRLKMFIHGNASHSRVR
jgi:hypothetical protein